MILSVILDDFPSMAILRDSPDAQQQLDDGIDQFVLSVWELSTAEHEQSMA